LESELKLCIVRGEKLARNVVSTTRTDENVIVVIVNKEVEVALALSMVLEKGDRVDGRGNPEI
jgi:hypothetical protein